MGSSSDSEESPWVLPDDESDNTKLRVCCSPVVVVVSVCLFRDFVFLLEGEGVFRVWVLLLEVVELFMFRLGDRSSRVGGLDGLVL